MRSRESNDFKNAAQAERLCKKYVFELAEM